MANLCVMNPDGTEQRAYYASSSFWPNRIFYAKPIPRQPTKFVGIVTGHHGTARAGKMVLFDVARGRRLAEGAVQRIPGWGKKVEAILEDQLVDTSWPKFLHPYPLSDKYFVPRGTVKRLRLFTYHFNYFGTSGIEDYVGMDGPWDLRRVLGTVPVTEDGSAYFVVPANTPIRHPLRTWPTRRC